jgi:uncharacterized membrane protein
MAEYGDTSQEKSANIAMLAYALLLAAPVLLVSALIGVIIAYVYRDDAPEWLQSHFQLQIRSFWISFLFFFIGLMLLWIFIGKLILLVTLIWYLVRLIKGLKYLNRRAPYPNPASWGF